MSLRISPLNFDQTEDLSELDDSVLVNVDELKADGTLAKSSNQSHGRSILQADRDGVLKVCRRLSLDELQNSHDAHLARTQAAEISAASTKQPLPTLDTDADSMVCAARFWLLFVGILGFRNVRAGSWWFLVISLPLLAQIVSWLFESKCGKIHVDVTNMALLLPSLCLFLIIFLKATSTKSVPLSIFVGRALKALNNGAT